MKFPIGIHVGDRMTLPETYEVAQYTDEKGFDSFWVAEGRMARDGIVPAAIVASQTKQIRIGTGVVNNKSRNVALMGVTFKTLDEVAPGRAILGIGAWWEPLATKLGAPIRKPVASMREYITILKQLFNNDTVTFNGEFYTIDGVRFDSMYRENTEVPVPIYVGAVGPRMLELSGEIADGVHMDFLLPPSYLEGAKQAIDAGLAKRTDGKSEIDLTQIIACSVNDKDPQEAIDHCKAFLTLYLMQQPHIAAHSGVEPELVEEIQKIAGWPATKEDIRRAMQLVPNELVQNVTACGSTDTVVQKLEEYREAGVRVPVLSTHGDHRTTLVNITEALQ
ncbi:MULTISPECIES: LLM class flavin-dependent oxidoreductase [Leucobacter]|uniref:LLM class flavin-dependent oxidoreductase n=1 Tax=Leucobacter TaxID=55968 RepID=UPI002108398B|nr:LLM class flavin-dependent oxidoreductase [Leucobacter aridicollis]UTX53502.1 LLM class flavin-dependent oxidoreductase [Leucobacter aridicollis]